VWLVVRMSAFTKELGTLDNKNNES